MSTLITCARDLRPGDVYVDDIGMLCVVCAVELDEPSIELTVTPPPNTRWVLGADERVRAWRA
jgi:hypothetical protein